MNETGVSQFVVAYWYVVHIDVLNTLLLVSGTMVFVAFEGKLTVSDRSKIFNAIVFGTDDFVFCGICGNRCQQDDPAYQKRLVFGSLALLRLRKPTSLSSCVSKSLMVLEPFTGLMLYMRLSARRRSPLVSPSLIWGGSSPKNFPFRLLNPGLTARAGEGVYCALALDRVHSAQCAEQFIVCSVNA